MTTLFDVTRTITWPSGCRCTLVFIERAESEHDAVFGVLNDELIYWPNTGGPKAPSSEAE